jgi:alkylation response protein AidB-like acyl-CoA dehydrogenase
VSYAAALIEIAAADGALSTILSIQNSLIVSALLRYGTPRSRRVSCPIWWAARRSAPSP